MIRKYIAIVVIGIAVSSAASAQSNQSTTAPSSTTKASGWLTHEQPGQWRASKLKGLDVYSDQNQKIGDINELIVDRSGKIVAVVIGVGGFLGLGEHDVAVPFGDLSWSPATTGTSGQANQSIPERAALRMTKDELKGAPEFKYAK